MSSSKRKWDQQADDAPAKAPKTEDAQTAPAAAAAGKTASDAAAAAAAIAAKIAAQFGTASGAALGLGGGSKDPHDAEFTHDIEINDVRNRYLLTKGQTQSEINEETGASVSTKGVWYPDKSRASEKDPPLYLHISANTHESLQKAIDKVNELIALDMGSLVEDRRRDGPMKRKWPEDKIPLDIEPLRNFNVRAKVVGPGGMFVKYIQQETGTRVQIKGFGSGFVDADTGRESDEPIHIHITGPEEGQIARAKALTEDLLEVVRGEHAKALAVLSNQQMELHHAQAQAAYSQYGGYAGYDQQAAQPPPVTDTAAYAAYWAAYGYDVNSDEFKKWQAEQQAQYAQYYAQAGYTVAPQPDGAPPPPPPGEGAPPPPPPS